MIDRENSLARRTVVKAAGLGLVAGALSPMPAARAADASESGAIWSGEYWAKKGDVPLWMYRKRIGEPKPGEAVRPVVFFVHGSSVTSRAFDLTVPGKGEYSVMNE
ncbi:MAG: alpha/beta hydrolase, partial [Bradyrhizobium sp.]|nr:alpha/beta hydrolase [Bradyrhizobium sp.]